MPYAPFTAQDYTLLESLIQGHYGGSWAQTAAYLESAGYDLNNIEDLCRAAGVQMNKNAAGRVISYEIPTTVSNTTTSPINSNVSVMKSGKTSGLVQLTNKTGNILGGSQLRGVGSKFITAGTKVAAPVAIASAFLFAGKTLDEIAYDVNPHMFEYLGITAESLNPHTWAQSIFPDNELGQDVINILLGYDPATGDAQTYMDSSILAYLMYAMQHDGVFAPSYTSYSIAGIEDYAGYGEYWTDPIAYTDIDSLQQYAYNSSRYYTFTLNSSSDTVYAVPYTGVFSSGLNVTTHVLFMSKKSFTVTWYQRYQDDDTVYTRRLSASSKTVDNKTVWTTAAPSNSYPIDALGFPFFNVTYNTWAEDYHSTSSPSTDNLVRVILYGTGTEHSPVPGVRNQPGATLPTFDGLTEDQYLPYLQNLYPDAFTDAINYPVLQPDGTTDNHTYVPVPFPAISNWADTQPQPSTSLQASPQIDPLTAAQDLVDTLVKVLQQPQPLEKTDPDTGYPDPPTNPPDTGGGSTPAAPIPTGSASALWSIYHPTQAQLDSFGAWLWSSNFVDQILKIFNDPMQSIIGLHKVYATPIDSGASTIAVGYLDSGVPSATVTQQYVTVDCGSVDLGEYFGNAFDYAPYTSVQLYLPFVGIVPLDVAQVMRSTISVVYDVDIFTGACLAKVDVSRDGGGGTLYQYSGDCAARYPLSSGSYMGIVSGIISIAGGIAATVATGGGAAPLALGAAGAALSAHTDVQHSGSFSGNAGAMGGKVPYLIINRPQTALADDIGHMAGYPANQTERIGACSGYIRATEIHDLAPSGATSDEVQQIIDAIREGVIV